MISDGGLVVFAAGNDADDGQWYPAYFSGAIAVAALERDSERAASFTNFGDWIYISAPGVNIYSTKDRATGGGSGSGSVAAAARRGARRGGRSGPHPGAECSPL